MLDDFLNEGLEVERVEGNLTYVKNATFPFKNAPNEATIEAVNLFKKLFKLQFPILDILNYVLQYDWAYRLRFIDLCEETTLEALSNNPRKELKRLIQINRERDYKETSHPTNPLVSDKITKLGNLLRTLLLIPTANRHFKRNLPKQLPTFDDIDLYWALQRKDYNIKGLSYEQRMDELTKRGWNKVV